MSESLKIGDYVLATKWGDGDPGDHWVIGFFAGMLPRDSGDRYMVVDANGKQFRGNGFRRAKQISEERGRWLLEHKQVIACGARSLWWWVRVQMDDSQGEGMSDKEKLSRWMLANNFATGHGDNIEDLLTELDWQVKELKDKSSKDLISGLDLLEAKLRDNYTLTICEDGSVWLYCPLHNHLHHRKTLRELIVNLTGVPNSTGGNAAER